MDVRFSSNLYFGASYQLRSLLFQDNEPFALQIRGAAVTIRDVAFVGNSGNIFGAALLVVGGTVYATNAVFDSNYMTGAARSQADDGGGGAAIFATASSSIYARRCSFVNNSVLE